MGKSIFREMSLKLSFDCDNAQLEGHRLSVHWSIHHPPLQGVRFGIRSQLQVMLNQVSVY